VDDHHRADRVVGAQSVRHGVGIGAVAPVTGHPLDVEAEALRHVAPERREVAGLERQHPVAGRERVDQRGLPGAGARRRVDDHGARRAQDPPEAREQLAAQRREVRPAVVDRRRVDRPQHPVGHVGGPWNLKEVASGHDALHAPHRFG